MRTPKGFTLLISQDLFQDNLCQIQLNGEPIGSLERKKWSYRAIAPCGCRKSFKGAKKAILHLIKHSHREKENKKPSRILYRQPTPARP